MSKSPKPYLYQTGVLLLGGFGLLVLSTGCTAREETPSRHAGVESLSTITNIQAEWLSDLIKRPPFQVEIVTVFLQEGASLFTNQTIVITNQYLVSFRASSGGDRILRGLNVPTDELSRVKQLEKGKSYVFPNALIE